LQLAIIAFSLLDALKSILCRSKIVEFRPFKALGALTICYHHLPALTIPYREN
jgi:hypothetical protein